MIRRKREFIWKEQWIQRNKRIQRNRGGSVYLFNWSDRGEMGGAL